MYETLPRWTWEERQETERETHHTVGLLKYFLGYFYLFATQLNYLKMPKEKKKNVGRDGEEA